MNKMSLYVERTTNPEVVFDTRMKRYAKRSRSMRIEKVKRTRNRDKAIANMKSTLKKRGYYGVKAKGTPSRSINSDLEKYFKVA